jgi:phosphoglycolate phosphatase-like HAD superfamily hydrolase
VTTMRGILLDFDGVVLESVAVKTRAFARLFERWPEHQQAIVDFHLKHGGVSRYEKFRYFYRTLLQEPLGPELEADLDRQLGALIADEMMACPFVPGALEFLEYFGPRLPIDVVSGTPEGELRRIVEDRGLARWFRGVYGSPASKRTIVEGLMAPECPAEWIMVGDAMTDWEAASAVGVPFVARIKPGDADPFPAIGPVLRVTNMTELHMHLRAASVAPARIP